jgi:hypothetical protein
MCKRKGMTDLFCGLAVDAWQALMTTELTTEARLFDYVFRLQNRRQPEIWERVLGLAMVDDTLTVKQPLRADELRRVHFAAEGVRAALGMLAGNARK